MRTLYPTMLILCLGIAALMFSLSGFGQLHENPAGDLESSEAVNDTVDNVSVKEDGGFSGQGSDGDNLLGFIVSAGQRIMSVASLSVKLPWEIAALGFPPWFAFPIGGLLQLIAGIGIVQFFSGRIWQ